MDLIPHPRNIIEQTLEPEEVQRLIPVPSQSLLTGSRENILDLRGGSEPLIAVRPPRLDEFIVFSRDTEPRRPPIVDTRGSPASHHVCHVLEVLQLRQFRQNVAARLLLLPVPSGRGPYGVGP